MRSSSAAYRKRRASSGGFTEPAAAVYGNPVVYTVPDGSGTTIKTYSGHAPRSLRAMRSAAVGCVKGWPFSGSAVFPDAPLGLELRSSSGVTLRVNVPTKKPARVSGPLVR